MSRETYTYSRCLPCSSCGSDSYGCQGSKRKGAPWRVTVQCLSCGYRVVHTADATHDFFRAAADAFANWNNQTRRHVA